MELLTSLERKIKPCAWVLLEDVQNCNPQDIYEDDTLELSFCVICETNDGGLYWECKVRDDEGIIYIPFRFHPDGGVALLHKQVFRNDKELMGYIDYLSRGNISTDTTFATSKSFHHYKFVSKEYTAWVVEVGNALYVAFYIDVSGVSLIHKKLLSLSLALFRAEKFIKGYNPRKTK